MMARFRAETTAKRSPRRRPRRVRRCPGRLDPNGRQEIRNHVNNSYLTAMKTAERRCCQSACVGRYRMPRSGDVRPRRRSQCGCVDRSSLPGRGPSGYRISVYNSAVQVEAEDCGLSGNDPFESGWSKWYPIRRTADEERSRWYVKSFNRLGGRIKIHGSNTICSESNLPTGRT